MSSSSTIAPTEINAYDALRTLQETWDTLDPYDRHATAVTVTKVAAAQGAEVPDHIFQYGGETLNPEFAHLMHGRLEASADDEARAAYTRLGKVAGVLPPEELVNLLFTIDDSVGLLGKYGSRFPDPLLCVFGQKKEANTWSWNHGGDYVNEGMLHRLAATPRRKELERLFSERFVAKFYKDPVAAFKTLTLNQQIIVSHLASQSGTSNNGGTGV